MDINWNKYFDAIYVINYIGYKKRIETFMRELERVDIIKHNNLIIRNTINNRFFDVFIKTLQYNRLTNLKKSGEMSLAFGHYFCLQHAFENKYDRILILEDDERFLKDKNTIINILDNIPNDAELIMFDKFPDTTRENMDTYKSNNKFNDYYYKLDNSIEMLSAGCYSLRKSVIEIMYNMYNSILLVADGYFKHIKCNKYFPITNLSVQATYGNSMNLASGETNCIHNRYFVDRINYDLYNIRDDGKPYKFGDIINE